MMEIEFRAQVKWNGNHYFSGEWVYGDLVRHADGKTYIYDSEDIVLKMPNGKSGFPGPRYEYVEVNPETVGMYTGLKDMNGNKIYSGDTGYMDNSFWTIEWDEKDAMFVATTEDLSLDFGHEDSRCFEVVGNIYDDVQK